MTCGIGKNSYSNILCMSDLHISDLSVWRTWLLQGRLEGIKRQGSAFVLLCKWSLKVRRKFILSHLFRSWMYQGWNDSGCHSHEWVRNTNAFIDRAFNAVHNSEKFGVLCPCSECGNRVRRRRAVMTMHLCKEDLSLGTLYGPNMGSNLIASLYWNVLMIPLMV
jgi:hypothetical protein